MIDLRYAKEGAALKAWSRNCEAKMINLISSKVVAALEAWNSRIMGADD